MNETNEPKPAATAEILDRIQAARADLTPELEKLAAFMLENPNEIGVCSIRQLAAKADVKPNTLVRLSRTIGMDSYESFREVFRDEIRQGRETYPDRARWLQSPAQRGEMGALYAASAESALDNIEGFFASTDHRAIEDLATAVEEDIKPVESVARGLKSRGYRPGPLVPDPAGGLNSEHSIRTPQQWMREAINGQAPIPPSAPPRSGADT